MRRLFAIAAALSCVLAIGAAASWVRSYWVFDRISCSERYRCAWEIFDAGIPFSRWPPGMPRGASSAALTSFGKILLERRVYRSEPLAAAPRGTGWASDDNVIPSFSYLHAVTGDITRSGHWSVRQVTLRHWFLVVLFAALPAAWLLAWGRRAGA